MQIRAFCYLILAGITEFKYGRKNEKDSGRSSKVTPSCKWPIDNNEYTVGVFLNLVKAFDTVQCSISLEVT